MLRSLFAASLLVVTLAGCSDLTGIGGVTGTWTLESLNGQRLPVTFFQSSTVREELVSSTLRLESDEEYVVRFTYRITTAAGARTETDETRGFYDRTGDEIRFEDPTDGGVTYGFLDGNRLELESSGDLYVYRR